MNPDTFPALLSKTELRWLRNDIKVSKSFEYKIKSSIKRKVQTLTELELPFLVKNNFFVNDDYNIDDGLGRDLESGPSLSYPSNDTVLVRQRSFYSIFLIVTLGVVTLVFTAGMTWEHDLKEWLSQIKRGV
jgi:hypothetical protein